MYIPFWPDFIVLSSFFAAVGFGAAWTIQNLRKPPPTPRPQKAAPEVAPPAVPAARE